VANHPTNKQLGAASLSAAKNSLTFCAVRLFITVETTARPLSYPVPDEASLLPPTYLFDHSNITLQLYLPSGIYHLVSPLNPLLDDQMFNFCRATDFSLLQTTHTGSGTHPASYSVATESSFPVENAGGGVKLTNYCRN
jgi:hypothetical protein